MNDRTVMLVRGLPGSGKTTLAKEFRHYRTDHGMDATHVEADMFFETENGYEFNPKKIKHAHEWCQNVAKESIESGIPVIVANTFTRISEMQPYLNLAEQHGANVLVYRCTGEYGTIHGVPDAVIEKMRNRFEDYPGEQIV